MKSKNVIVRGDRSGVFVGTLKTCKLKEVTLKNARKLWYWDGACAVEQLAKDGVADSKTKNCKFTVAVEELTILDAIQILPCTDKAFTNLMGVKEWKI